MGKDVGLGGSAGCGRTKSEAENWIPGGKPVEALVKLSGKHNSSVADEAKFSDRSRLIPHDFHVGIPMMALTEIEVPKPKAIVAGVPSDKV